MREYLCLRGTKEKIAVDLATELELSPEDSHSDEFRQFASLLVDFIDENHKYFDSIEYHIEKSNNDSSHGLVGEGGSYFIGVKKPFHILIYFFVEGIIKAKGLDSPIFENIFNAVEMYAPVDDMPLFKSLGEGTELNCILLEAAKYKKKGIKNDHFVKFKGECIRNDLQCRLRKDGRCTCDNEETHESCSKLVEFNILKESHGKFYYVDII